MTGGHRRGRARYGIPGPWPSYRPIAAAIASPPRRSAGKAWQSARPALSRPGRGLERWQSGRMRRSRKPLYARAYRGFESLPLRHLLLPENSPLPDPTLENRRYPRVSGGKLWTAQVPGTADSSLLRPFFSGPLDCGQLVRFDKLLNTNGFIAWPPPYFSQNCRQRRIVNATLVQIGDARHDPTTS